MTLVDSSCWVEYYRPAGVPTVQAEVAAAIEADEAAICGLIEVEILGNIAAARERDVVAGDFTAFHWLETEREEYRAAAAIGQALRARGSSAPATDLVIAAVAIANDALLLHRDRHFAEIASVSALRERLIR